MYSIGNYHVTKNANGTTVVLVNKNIVYIVIFCKIKLQSTARL